MIPEWIRQPGPILPFNQDLPDLSTAETRFSPVKMWSHAWQRPKHRVTGRIRFQQKTNLRKASWKFPKLAKVVDLTNQSRQTLGESPIFRSIVTPSVAAWFPKMNRGQICDFGLGTCFFQLKFEKGHPVYHHKRMWKKVPEIGWLGPILWKAYDKNSNNMNFNHQVSTVGPGCQMSPYIHWYLPSFFSTYP